MPPAVIIQFNSFPLLDQRLNETKCRRFVNNRNKRIIVKLDKTQ